jgi:capsular polysaccharide biosynthesis protein
MSEPGLDLRRSLRLAWRHRTIVGIVAALGLLLGAGYATLHPSMLTSKTLIILPPNTPNMATEVVIAGSDPVLTGALPSLPRGTTLAALRNHVKVRSVTSTVLSFSATGTTAATAQATATAVAASYLAYVGSSSSPVGHIAGRVIQPATPAAGTSPLVHQLSAGLIGAILGTLIGIIVALAARRRDRTLRERDQIANSIGVPVLASLPVDHPSDPAEWVKLLDGYQPDIVDAWHLRKALQYLGVSGASPADGNSNGHGNVVGIGVTASLTVISLSSDRDALALGPQLAVFAASLDIPTTLVIGPQGDANAAAALRTACAASEAASSQRPGRLRVAVAENGDFDPRPRGRLTIVVTVVDSDTPKMPDTVHTSAAVLGVSAGGATAEQLARAAVCAAVDGRDVVGILVADPDKTDRSTGRIPRLAQPAAARRKMPTRLNGFTTEIRR